MGTATNVKEAIEQLGAERVGHGVRVLEDENVVALARERDSVRGLRNEQLSIWRDRFAGYSS